MSQRAARFSLPLLALCFSVLAGCGNSAPSLTIVTPAPGSTLGPADDLDPATAGLQIAVDATTNAPDGSTASASSGSATATSTAMGGKIHFDSVTLLDGTPMLTVSVTSSDHNKTKTVIATYTVSSTSGPSLAVVSPVNGSEVGQSALTSIGGSAQVDFVLKSTGIAGQTVTVDCGSGVTGNATIAADGSASIPLLLTIASCQGALFQCTATAGSLTAQTTTFTADNTAPGITIVLPAAGITSQTSTEFQATTSCAGEGQVYTVANGSTVISSGTVQSNLIDIPSVALHGGQNDFHVTVTDGAHNTGTSDVEVTNSSTAFPAVAFVSPTDGASLDSTSSLLSCSNTAVPTLNQVQISISGDSVTASGLVLTLTNSSGTTTVASTPTFANGMWSWTDVALAPESNTLMVTATDSAGSVGTASVTFAARCTALAVSLTFVVSGNSFGYAQDKDHTTPGVQVDVQIATTNVANGSAVRICSTAASAVPGGCTTPGTGALAVAAGTPAIQANAAAFTVTLPDGSQTVYAEVNDVTTQVSDAHLLTARANPPTVASIKLQEDTQGQALTSAPDNALNQTEMDAANGTVHFFVAFGANSFVAGKTVQILSTSTPAVLGVATVAQNGDGTTTTSVPVALSQLNTGGYQSYVFYAQVTDDAGNKDSTPSAPLNNVTATTLGTAADPFVIAPTPTVSLTSPAPGTTELNASNDVRCSVGVCPESDPLIYAFAASTSAPDASPEGVKSEITFFSGGTAITPGSNETNPTQTSSSAVSVDLPIANSPSVALTAQVDDPYGNVATSAATTLIVDSIPPELAITTINGNATPVATVNAPNFNVIVAVDATGQGTLESGRGISIYSGATVVGSGSYAGSSTGAGTLTISVSLPVDGAYTLIAKAADAAGNAGASPAQNVTQVYVGPTVTLTSPAAVSGQTLWFGIGTKSGSICAPQLTFTTTHVPDNQTVLAWTVPAGTSCGTPPGNAVGGTVTSSVATLSAAGFDLTDGASATLCAQATDGINSQQSAPQLVKCDLDTPTVAWVSPTAGQTFNAFGQTIGSQTASTSSSTTALGLASAQLTVTAPNGGTLVLSVDEANTPAVTTTSFVSCMVPASTGETIYALGSSNCSTTSGSGQLLVPVDYAQLLAHTLTASLTAPSGNAATPAAETVNIDVAEPAAASASASFNDVTGVGTVTVSTIPGDDQTSGGAPAGWEVRYSQASLTASNWSGGTLVSANLAGALPSGVPASFQVVLPAGNALYLGVRAKDRVGNLGDVGAGSVVQVSTIPNGNVVEIDPGGTVPTSTIAGDVAIRVADIDNDGYDDIILNYPSSSCDSSGCSGQIFIYFGSAAGITSSTTPVTLTGTLTDGYLGEGQAFDVGRFAATSYVDIAAGEIQFDSTGAAVAANVLVWTGAQLAGFKAGTVTTLTPTVLSDPSAFIGGTVRAVGAITGGSSAGDDLLLNNYQINDGSAGPYQVAILPRGGAWIASGTGDAAIFSTGSPAAAFIVLPATIGTDAFAANAVTDSVFVEAATFSYTPVAGAAAVPGLLVSLVYDVGGQGNEHDLRVFGTGTIQAGGTISWSLGTPIPTPSRVDAGANVDVFGEFVSGGKDAIGNASNDLLIADPSNGELYAFDGDQLLGVNGTGNPNYIWYSAGDEGHLIGRGAFLMGDLDGDGKSEITGGNDPSATTSPAYFFFGETGDNGPLANSPIPALPELPFAQSGCVGSSSPDTFCLIPGRGQRLSRAPLFSSNAFSSLPFGQALRAGHFSSQTSLDLVVLSQGGDADGSAPGYLVFMR